VHDPVRIEEGVELEDAEIGPNVTIEAGSVIRSSRLRDCILGENVRIEDSTLHDSLIADGAQLRRVAGSVSVAAYSLLNGD
jgi:glucose-1-phosphate thymidylyltransferase